jgi:hypothetical protein
MKQLSMSPANFLETPHLLAMCAMSWVFVIVCEQTIKSKRTPAS